MHYEEVPLDNDTVLLDYDSGQQMKSCRVMKIFSIFSFSVGN